MSKIHSANDSIWHEGSSRPDWDAEYEEHKARKDSHRADARGLSDEDLYSHHDDLADDIKLDEHNEYPFFDHFFNSVGVGTDNMPEKTPEQKAHDDLKIRHDAFGDELDARGLWGPKAEAERQKMMSHMDNWPKNYAHRERLIAGGILDPDSSYSGDKGFDKYMGEAGFDLAKAKSIGANYQEEGARVVQRKMKKLFGEGGFDPSNPEHQAIRNQVFKEYKDRK